jgi:hypothetical protein
VFSYFGWAGAVAAGVILSLLATISVLARNKKPVVSAGSSN